MLAWPPALPLGWLPLFVEAGAGSVVLLGVALLVAVLDAEDLGPVTSDSDSPALGPPAQLPVLQGVAALCPATPPRGLKKAGEAGKTFNVLWLRAEPGGVRVGALGLRSEPERPSALPSTALIGRLVLLLKPTLLLVVGDALELGLGAAAARQEPSAGNSAGSQALGPASGAAHEA